MANWNSYDCKAQHLVDITATIIQKQLIEVYYYDISDDGIASFQSDNFDHRDELAWGVDLVCNEMCLGFTWVWHSAIHEYGIGVFPDGIRQSLKHGAVRSNQSASPRWQSYLGHTIDRCTFSRATQADATDPVCDCRIDFKDAPSIWICARQANSGCDANGDDCVIVFTEHEAARLGIDTTARS